MNLLIKLQTKRLKDEKPVELKVIINNVNPDQTLREVLLNRNVFDVFNNIELEIDKEEVHIYEGYTTFIK